MSLNVTFFDGSYQFHFLTCLFCSLEMIVFSLSQLREHQNGHLRKINCFSRMVKSFRSNYLVSNCERYRSQVIFKNRFLVEGTFWSFCIQLCSNHYFRLAISHILKTILKMEHKLIKTKPKEPMKILDKDQERLVFFYRKLFPTKFRNCSK